MDIQSTEVEAEEGVGQVTTRAHSRAAKLSNKVGRSPAAPNQYSGRYRAAGGLAVASLQLQLGG